MGVIVAALGGAVAALLLVAIVAVLRRGNRSRADLALMLAASQREVDDLRARLDELSALLTVPVERVGEQPREQSYVITDAGRTAVPAVPTEDQIEVPDRLVLSAILGAPLVKVAAFGHGLRRALSAESRNKIRFEMRREVRASRKRRRQLLKQYERDLRAAERSAQGQAQQGMA